MLGPWSPTNDAMGSPAVPQTASPVDMTDWGDEEEKATSTSLHVVRPGAINNAPVRDSISKLPRPGELDVRDRAMRACLRSDNDKARTYYRRQSHPTTLRDFSDLGLE